ncbi:MAG: hypothetical protein A2900_00900 [Candidatus Chisholmbacteria bacterium RIFCSPLOWO2_01_FULL_50_28]|uniref:Uncharacterized protein n=1 Tax=Candidatus Chisholmbacteria bacterium RIFCSPHIGHO2_01_FULL_52_32 TaxID=1797591 RepID=A0A1G1VUJ8_9BACT|nr:MAG: hypothetical protein A2786_05960 [Candidatus Chisholmbacteria bacterium RIFCSPHIGHO2_01_FULL_52_32]OGY19647.1 MAG: hypothetical protein A2900_00900 [Candidatus Chisholmbacteria bacterium RIFCSPLOWO2_01_FULL_50_28]
MLNLFGVAFAAPSGAITVTRPVGFQITDVGSLIAGAIGAAFLVSGIIVFGFLVWGGIQWITSGGDKANVEAARNRISSALVGMAIIAAAYAVIRLVEFFFGITVLEGITLPTGY